MSEPEFDAYLTFLSKLLGLTRGRQADILMELRGHLEERCDELIARGHSRGEAVRLAIDELGDAAVLAADFQPSLLVRRRRQVMRYSMISAGLLVATVVGVSVFGPGTPDIVHRPQPIIHAQTNVSVMAGGSGMTAGGVPVELSELQKVRKDIESKLAQRDLAYEFQETPLPDVLTSLTDSLDLDFLIDRGEMTKLDVDLDTPVTLKAREGSLSVRTALELMIHQIAPTQLVVTIRDGAVLITGPQSAYENEVYDCRDLLANSFHDPSLPPGMAAMGAPGMPGGATFSANPTNSGGGGSKLSRPTSTSPNGAALIGVICQAAPAEWEHLSSSGGTISEFDGLIIVHHNQQVQTAVADLLKKLRAVRGQ